MYREIHNTNICSINVENISLVFSEKVVTCGRNMNNTNFSHIIAAFQSESYRGSSS